MPRAKHQLSRNPKVQERLWRAFDLRLKGWTYNAIGKALGVSGVTAWNYVGKALAYIHERHMAEAEHALAQALARREMLLRRALSEADQLQDSTPAATQARSAALNVASVQLKAIEEMLGLYRSDVSQQITVEGGRNLILVQLPGSPEPKPLGALSDEELIEATRLLE